MNGLRLTFRVDANTLEFSGFVAVPDNSLHRLISQLPLAAATIINWMPDICLGGVGFSFEPNTKAFALDATAGVVGAVESSAGAYIAMGASGAMVVGMELTTPIDLGATPVLGSLLSGITLQDIGISYATQAFKAGQIKLPPPAPPTPAFAAGINLGLTISAAGSSRTFAFSPNQGNSQPPQFAHLTPVAKLGDDSPTIQWFDVGKTLGPLTISRLGIVTFDGLMGVGIDASLATSALSVALTGFYVAFKQDDISLKGLRISLDGLEVSFRCPSVTVAGSLVRTLNNGTTEYDGSVLIQAGKYGISAVGAFGEVDGAVSMFIFGLAEGPFGGPPAFFVTGIAAGFGYNRDLVLPASDQVAKHPFIRAATEGRTYINEPKDPNAALSTISKGGWVPPRHGQYWLAAGIRFTSFQLFNSFVVVNVQFGHELIIALLGISSVQLPVAPAKPYAYAELTLDAVLRPAAGTFQMTALLTPNSFVIDPNCRLTGGFAFWLWFGNNEHCGDFVVTLGGYNPNYTKPQWYPDIPRLGFDWNVSSDLHIRGGAYFALTPAAIMAGASLSTTYQHGSLRAWFTANADFVMWWKPFYFIVDVGVAVGASYTLDLGIVSKTFCVELSADLSLWGPPLAGKAYVKWWVISFTVDINGGGEPTPVASVLPNWNAFADTYLPDGGRTYSARTGTHSGKQADNNSQICRPLVASGLTQTVDPEGDPIWIVSPTSVVLACESIVPATILIVDGPTVGAKVKFTSPEVGVYPLGSLVLGSTLTLTVTPWLGGSPLDLSSWYWSPERSNAPNAMWGQVNDGSPPLSAGVVASMTGATGVPPPPTVTGPDPVPIENLTVEHLPARPLPLSMAPPYDGGTPQPSTDPRTVVATTVMAPAVVLARRDVVGVLEQAGVGSDLTAGDLSLLRDEVWATFQAAPMLGPLGTTGPRQTTQIEATFAPAMPRPKRVAGAVSRVEGAVLRAAFHSSAEDGRAIAHVLDGFATPLERAHVLGLRAVAPGTTLLWQVPEASGLSVVAEGPVPVRVVVLDRVYRALTDVILRPPMRRFRLPNLAAHVAVSGLGLAHDVLAPVGWTARTALLQLAPQALLGNGVVVRPQAPLRVRIGRGSRTVGVTCGGSLVAKNLVQHDDVGALAGWIETRLPPGTRTVATLLRRRPGLTSTAADAVRVSAATASLRLGRVVQDGDSVTLVHEIDAGVEEPVHVTVPGTAGWDHQGVLGFASVPLDEFATSAALVALIALQQTASDAAATEVHLR